MPENLSDARYEDIGDGILMFYENLASFKPMDIVVRIKENDSLSAGMPFKEYVSIIIYLYMQKHIYSSDE